MLRGTHDSGIAAYATSRAHFRTLSTMKENGRGCSSSSCKGEGLGIIFGLGSPSSLHRDGKVLLSRVDGGRSAFLLCISCAALHPHPPPCRRRLGWSTPSKCSRRSSDYTRTCTLSLLTSRDPLGLVSRGVSFSSLSFFLGRRKCLPHHSATPAPCTMAQTLINLVFLAGLKMSV
ncbi:hypothetical protein GQ43DRAFT_207870 [Delitschia confertaspora ATCC 74209]|uniref:Uncharacterized protein n=1 Tax=Delitschia confertaspora ATCC 74209 TaxID=1513339 RepID=A0A9P4MUW6_9PLEO|nr:hypothetical protein GQ43DRAFT_207870 [Delitschia confertaspora ATCC 74209]